MNIEESITGKIVVIMAIITAIWYIIWLINKNNDWWLSKIPSQYSFKKSYPLNKEKLFECCLESSKRSKFKVKQADSVKGVIKAKTNWSMSSFGESIEIDIIENGNKTIVAFFSMCNFTATVYAWGKNRRNANNFFRNLENTIVA